MIYFNQLTILVYIKKNILGTGRNEVPFRFVRHSNIFSIDPFDDETISTIFSTDVSWHFKVILII